MLLLSGCKMADVDNLIESRNRTDMSFTAAFENADTRTYVDNDLYMYWTADDRLSIFTSTYNEQYKFDGNTGDTGGSFSKVNTGQFVTGNPISTNYGVYPYNASTVLTKEEKIELELPAVLQYAVNSFGMGANTMVAVTGGTNDFFLPFKNVCGYLVVKLYGEGIVKSVTFEGNNGEKIAGAATVVASHNANPEITMSENATTSITIDCGEGVELGKTADTATEFWFVIPPTSFENGFVVKVVGDGASDVLRTSNSREIQRNIVNTMSPIKAILTATDLSMNGTANCYIVSDAGNYKFRADVKGQSNERLSGITSAEVLWESFNTDVIPKCGDIISFAAFEDGYIYFTTAKPFKYGNAVIAAKDKNGDILWSWHIWAVDYNPEFQYDIYLGHEKDKVMDRNLGALSAVPGDVQSLGLLYQWGRKDPFLVSSSISSSVKSQASVPFPVSVPCNQQNGTIDYATKHPMTYIYYGNRYDWLYSETIDDTRWNEDMDIYNPCPAGWTVSESSSEGVWSEFPNGTVTTYWDNVNKGLYITLPYSNNGSWYPACGFLGWKGDLYNTGKQGSIWSSSPNPEGYTGFCAKIFDFGSDGIIYHDHRSHASDGTGAHRADALSVRCIKKSEMNAKYYIDNGVNYGQGIEIDGTVWAPVNCGYKDVSTTGNGFVYGKLYQFGRKDGQGYGEPWSRDTKPDEYYFDETIPTIAACWNGANEEADANTHYYGTEGSVDYDWITPQNDHFWNSGTEEKPVKTQYDPCPAGWRIPTAEELSKLTKLTASSLTILNNVYGWWLSDNNSNEKLFFPAPGARYADNWFHSAGAKERGKSAYYRSSLTSGVHSVTFNLKLNNTNETVMWIDYGEPRGAGYSVRCVAH